MSELFKILIWRLQLYHLFYKNREQPLNTQHWHYIPLTITPSMSKINSIAVFRSHSCHHGFLFGSILLRSLSQQLHYSPSCHSFLQDFHTLLIVVSVFCYQEYSSSLNAGSRVSEVWEQIPHLLEMHSHHPNNAVLSCICRTAFNNDFSSQGKINEFSLTFIL